MIFQNWARKCGKFATFLKVVHYHIKVKLLKVANLSKNCNFQNDELGKFFNLLKEPKLATLYEKPWIQHFSSCITWLSWKLQIHDSTEKGGLNSRKVFHGKSWKLAQKYNTSATLNRPLTNWKKYEKYNHHISHTFSSDRFEITCETGKYFSKLKLSRSGCLLFKISLFKKVEVRSIQQVD